MAAVGTLLVVKVPTLIKVPGLLKLVGSSIVPLCTSMVPKLEKPSELPMTKLSCAPPL